MSHDSTIPSRLDPMQTMPAPLVPAAPKVGRQATQAGIGRVMVIVAVALIVVVVASRFLT